MGARTRVSIVSCRNSSANRRFKATPCQARQCKAPTDDKSIALFEHQRRHRLLDGDTPVKTFWDPLNDIMLRWSDQDQEAVADGLIRRSFGKYVL